MLAVYLLVKYKNKEIKMPGNILGEASPLARATEVAQNGFTGVNLSSGAFIGYRNPKRQPKEHTGSGAGSSAFAANDPRRVDIAGPARDTGNATPNAEPTQEEPAKVQNQEVTADGGSQQVDNMRDLRAVLKVPPSYLGGNFSDIFTRYGGILFPYTPQITLESKAEYTSNTPLHSNYPINFYKSSAVSDITVTAQITVQNQEDAEYYVGMVRMLSALTKMRFGDDPLAGSPPPICRFYAYGEYMLKNVPVVITSFRHDLPDDCDFFTTYVLGERVSVPTKASFTINLKPTYSRKEMAQLTVDAFVKNTFAGRGYL